MPELGSLWYSVGLKDLTDADIKKINDKLKNLGSDLLINPKLAKSVTEILPKGIKLELDPQLKAVSNEALAKAVEGKVLNISVKPLMSNLRTALREATKDNPPEMEVGVQSAKLRRVIENVLNKQGFMLNISTVNDNYSKVVQQKLNGTRYTVKIHADAKEITRSVQTSLMQVQSRAFGLQVSRDMLYRSIDDALGHKRFTINVAVQHDQARKAVQDALLKAQVIGKDQALAYQRLQTGEMKAAQAEILRLKAAHMGAADAAKAHATASINLGGALGSNIKIAGELGSAMASLYSVHAAKEFLSQVIEIGGELEHQKIAMDTIFGDKGKTSELFGQIKGLARQSPFGVMELTKSVKALSAYGVQYNEIYDTAKRLADISAATSIDINRLILAFGKTKSRGFLDGLEAKQFAYANIPIYEMVRRKLEELEGQAVTTAQVMERMKKREIGFDIVKDVLWDMTDEGGKFYNMQEALAGSVKTSWKLVRDNIELMFGEIAESWVGSGLKEIGEILQKLTREWQTVGVVIGTAAASMGVAKLATFALNRVVAQNTGGVTANIMANKRLEADYLTRIGLVRKLSTYEKERIATQNRLTAADISRALAEKKLTSVEVQQLYISKQLTRQEILRLFHMGEITKAEARMILTTNRAAVAIRSLGHTIGAGLLSALKFLISPISLITIGITGITYGLERYREQGAKAEEIGKNIFTKATEGAKNLSKTVEEIKPAKGLSDLELTRGIEEMENAIKDYSATPIRDINESLVAQDGHLLTLTERYEVLKQKVDELLESYQKIEDTNENDNYDKIITPSLEASGGFFQDGILENAKDYTNEIREAEDFISKKLQSERTKIEKFVNWAKKISPEFRKAAEGMNLNAAYKELVMGQDKYDDVYSHNNYYIQNLTKSFKNGRDKFYKDIEEFSAEVKTRMRTEWNVYNVEDLDENQKNMLVIMFNAMIEKAEGTSEQVKQEWRGILAKTFNISFDPAINAVPIIGKEFSSNIEDYVGEALAESIRKGASIDPNSDDFQKARQAVSQAAISIIGGANSDTQKAINEAISEENLNQTTGLVLQSLGKKYMTSRRDGGDTQKDEFAESLKQRFKDIKDAWSEFLKWSKTEGRGAAATRIGESGLFSTLSADKIPQTVEQYRALVVELENELRQAGVKGTARESLLNDLLKQLLDIDKTVVDEQLKLALDKVSKEAERQLADWNLFDKIRKATGNQDLAMSIAFGMNATAETDYPAMIKQQFNDFAKAAKSVLTFDTATPELLANAPDEVKKAWEDATKKLQQYAREQKDAIADILNEYQSLQDKLTKIDADRERKIKTVNESDMSAPDKAKYIQRINVEADYQKFTQSADYLKFFSGIYSLTMEKAQEIGDKIRLHLDQRLQAGKISAEDYYKEIERINQQLSKLRNVKSDALTFLTGGVKGVQQKKLDIADSKVLDQMTKVQEAQEALEKAKASGDIKQIAAAELTLNLAETELETRLKIRDAIVKDMEGWQKVLDVVGVVNNIAGGMSDAFNTLRDMADSFGFDTESNAWETAAAVMDTLTTVTGGVQKVIQSAMSGDIGGIIGGAFDTLLTPFTIWSKLHDKKLQKDIELSKRRFNQYDRLVTAIERKLNDHLGGFVDFDPMPGTDYGKDGAFGYERDLKKAQLEELKRQQADMEAMKKKDPEAIEDIKAQISELTDEIANLEIEAANTLYGIDIKGYAETIGDALWDAFMKGEDAAEAFDKAVADIMSNVVKNILKVNVLERAFQKTKDWLASEDGPMSDGILDESEARELWQRLMTDGKKGMENWNAAMDAMPEDMKQFLQDNYDTSKSGLSAGIQSVTEDTADLLASYINQIRADVAMQTGSYWTRLLDDALPQTNVIAQSQLDTQRQIAENTLRNAVAAEAIQVSTAKLVELNDQMGRSWRRIAERNWGYS